MHKNPPQNMPIHIPLPPSPYLPTHIYQQLKHRQLQYIQLIKDLHHENYRLRMLLAQYQQQQLSQGELINTARVMGEGKGQHCRTPSFNSIRNSRAFGHANNVDGVPDVRIKINKVDDQRYSFTDLQSQPDAKSLFSNLLASPSDLKNQKQLEIKNTVSKQKLWNAKTNKSISKGQSRASDHFIDGFGSDDGVSEYSEICQRMKPSNNIVQNLINRDSRGTHPDQLRAETGQNRKKQKPSRDPIIQKIENNISDRASPRNRLAINNKVYL